jgi:hypothetical protein
VGTGIIDKTGEREYGRLRKGRNSRADVGRRGYASKLTSAQYFKYTS